MRRRGGRTFDADFESSFGDNDSEDDRDFTAESDLFEEKDPSQQNESDKFIAQAAAVARRLDPGYERELIRASRKGDRRATGILVKHYMAFIRWCAGKYATGESGRELADLVQVGAIGFMNAIQRFDLSRRESLLAYASPWVRGAVSDYARGKTDLILVPENIQRDTQWLDRAEWRLSQRLGHAPSDVELAMACEISAKKVWEIRMFRSLKLIDSIDRSMPGLDEDFTVADTVADARGREPEARAKRDDVLRLLHKMGSGLVGREKQVYVLRILQEKTLEQTGAIVGISAERVRQIENKIKDDCRRRYYEEAKVLFDA